MRLVLNQREVVTIQCSPGEYEQLGVGFLYTNGLINKIDEILSMDHTADDGTLSVTLATPEIQLPQRHIVFSSGFGGVSLFSGTSADHCIESGFQLPEQRIIELFSEMKRRAAQYIQFGGIHATAICSCDRIVCMSEDIGRQNSMDKAIGVCLMSDVSFKDKAIITTGRISFEMVLKALRAGITVLASLSSPTAKAVEMASKSGIAIAGYVTDNSLIGYSNEHRLGE